MADTVKHQMPPSDTHLTQHREQGGLWLQEFRKEEISICRSASKSRT